MHEKSGTEKRQNMTMSKSNASTGLKEKKLAVILLQLSQLILAFIPVVPQQYLNLFSNLLKVVSNVYNFGFIYDQPVKKLIIPVTFA